MTEQPKRKPPRRGINKGRMGPPMKSGAGVRRHRVTLRLNDGEVDLIDSRRGTLSRAEFVRRLCATSRLVEPGMFIDDGPAMR